MFVDKKTVHEKAMEWLTENVTSFTDEQLKSLQTLLKVQDRDTRHAVADAVDLYARGGECNVDVIIGVCINARAV